MLSANRVDFGLFCFINFPFVIGTFLFHKFSNFTPPPQIQLLVHGAKFSQTNLDKVGGYVIMGVRQGGSREEKYMGVYYGFAVMIEECLGCVKVIEKGVYVARAIIWIEGRMGCGSSFVGYTASSLLRFKRKTEFSR